jgi:hypothetical protein
VICFAHAYYDEFVSNLGAAPAAHDLYVWGLNMLLILPAKPEGNPFDGFKALVTGGLKREWSEDERIMFALESIVVLSHAMRNEYVVRVDDVDSNDVLFAGSREFRSRGVRLMSRIFPKLMQALEQLRARKATRVQVPMLALRAMATLPDVCGLEGALMPQMKVLANMTVGGEGQRFLDIKRALVRHLARGLVRSEEGRAFVKKFAQGLE